ncbi:MAG TPA: hypothetical protein VH117_03215 [Edaphobacter sp.]|jgi:hypothetical protein|nr:hypothetical protein [Edaphobacter sp.]
MSQVLQIFKKDARHLWPEILISLAMTVAFVCVSVSGWSTYRHFGIDPLLPIIAGLLSTLVPVSWWVLSARLIHDESLVGDNQFWVTRPYRWQSLLAAKALFLLAFLYLPIFVAQGVLLAEAGFHPVNYLPGLLYNLVLLTCVLVLPIAAIATVTPNFARFTLTVLGAAAYIGVILWACSSIPFLKGSAFPNLYADKLTFFLFFFIFLLVIALQYATRRTWRSRWLLLALPFLVIVCNLAWPIQTLARRLYPPLSAADQLPVHLTFDPDPARQEPHPASHWTKDTHFFLPLTVAGVPSGTLIRNEVVQVSIEASNGAHWNSNWQLVSQSYFPNTVRSYIDIPMDPKFLNHIPATPVTVTVSFALIQLQAGTTVTSQPGDQNFSLPGGGTCSVSDTAYGTYPECRFPMAEPGLTFLTARWTDGPCSQTPSIGSGTLGDAGLGTIDPALAEFGLDPVKIRPLVFSNQPRNSTHPTFICPGTPISATPYSVVRRVQTTLTIPNLDLTKYTTDHPERIAMSYSIAN